MSSLTRFNRLFDSKFRGCKQIGYKDDVNVEGRRLLIYELPTDVLSDEERAVQLVGINDGSSCWIGSLNSALSNYTRMSGGAKSNGRVKLNVLGTTTGRIRSSIQTESNTPKVRRRVVNVSR